ncbi:23S rRNA (adenine(1618)-N(6))-methyltransferase RlmF [Aquimarina sp. 2201CG5-10]|uniref:23S rRNA (adenine(1618)-N(6))-methyltransferase RlmF n=1 Tax=Aquimarina callyspongiae TaxID=3098150 RepID=UPI002AB414B9|nr:23S rRNA (adenine(1618)-N(6))-methyltransferase RlmF [Aquimarina sp. 2201CG5-10]MDY8136166.1 23S rRNA (adenine(1618)-N(6))-methyltransferase RlmF [Aquimarina sp. 2201CG5-10]
MHPRNIHNSLYDFKALIASHPELSNYIIVNSYKNQSIDYSNPDAVLHLNKAILKHHYHLSDWNIPKDYLCPPIPGRADYIHHIADLLQENETKEKIRGLDIGVGANCIYPILGTQIYNWKMVGADINTIAVESAKKNILATPKLSDTLEIRHQKDPSHIFEGIIKPGEYYDFSICNPPFHPSKEAATKGTLRKIKNLNNQSDRLNFGGQANELWCNGGEALFVKRMIKQSTSFKTQVGWFTSLISKKENLPKLYKQLNKLNAIHKTIEMEQGNKRSRFIAWKF